MDSTPTRAATRKAVKFKIRGYGNDNIVNKINTQRLPLDLICSTEDDMHSVYSYERDQADREALHSASMLQ